MCLPIICVVPIECQSARLQRLTEGRLLSKKPFEGPSRCGKSTRPFTHQVLPLRPIFNDQRKTYSIPRRGSFPVSRNYGKGVQQSYVGFYLFYRPFRQLNVFRLSPHFVESTSNVICWQRWEVPI